MPSFQGAQGTGDFIGLISTSLQVPEVTPSVWGQR